ncbi:MAG: hypothetical protein ACRCX2_33975 [Paraclostridium sp.]
MYSILNIHSKQIYECKDRFVAARLIGCRPAYVVLVCKKGLTTRHGWQITQIGK